jgi:uncharacterized iron-regulated membrane protein
MVRAAHNVAAIITDVLVWLGRVRDHLAHRRRGDRQRDNLGHAPGRSGVVIVIGVIMPGVTQNL